MQRLFSADVIDIELLYHPATGAILYYYAKRYNIKYIIDGVNSQTEGIRIPNNWRWYKFDALNIKSISQDVKYSNFPYFGTLDRFRAKISGFKRISILNYIQYNKGEALNELTKGYNYTQYSGKHEESTFTKFYQDIILPLKFGIDKRRLHLSDLILNGEIKREQALKILNFRQTLEEFLENDRFILNKLQLKQTEFRDYINREPKSHSLFKNEYRYVNSVKKMIRRP